MNHIKYKIMESTIKKGFIQCWLRPIFNSTIHFQFIIVLLLVVACHSANDNDNPQLPSDVAADTFFEPTGNAELDSLLQLAAVAKQDTTLARLYFDIAELYLDNEPQKARVYYFKLKELSEKLNWINGDYLFAVGYTDILNREGSMDSSIVVLKQALELGKTELDELKIATLTANIGNCYNFKKWFETALTYYNDALNIMERRDDKYRLAHMYYLMATIYSDMDMQDENLLYCEKAVSMMNEKPDTLLRAYTLINYAVGLLSDWQLDKAEECLLEAQRIATLHNSMYVLKGVFCNLGDLALKKNDWDLTEMYARKVLEMAIELGDVSSYCISNRSLGYVEEYRGHFDKSEEYARQALKTADEYDLPTEKMKCYTLLSDISTARHDFRNYRYYEAKSDSVQTAIMSEKTVRAVKEMEAKYETAKKELKITALEEEKRFMSLLSIFGGAVLLLSLAFCFFLWRWTVQKKRLAEQQIKQLIQEKQLVATQSVLDGETRERARLARDLHDGLGSLLTGAKLQLLEMKQGVKLEYSDVERFDKALGLLDDSVSEMRRVAHHLMPDSLSRFGLKPAVTDFCLNLPTVQFTYYGDESRLDPNMEVMIYRSIHELVNNALKHAAATRIMVQIIREPDRIAFTVQDDGSGFDPSVVTEGMGLQNIRTRVEAYNGMIDIHSNADEGTEINVELRNDDKP